jgi:predicted porin
MKKELLIGTALVSTLGAASVAEAVTATMSGNHQTGLEVESPDSGGDARNQNNDNNFTVSLSETTDGGMTISSSFMLMNENGSAGDLDAGFTLEFTDGSKLDLLNAGNASGSHDISIPGSAGSEGITMTTANKAPTGLDFATGATVYGVEYHSAADFLADGLKVSVSASTDNGVTSSSSWKNDEHYAIGATYVTDMGDTALTIGTGYSTTGGSITGTTPTTEENSIHFGISAVTGDLTVAVGFADGDDITTAGGTTSNIEATADVVKAGVKYVSGDLTFNIGMASGEATDNAFGSTGGSTDSADTVGASVSYAVASGVTAILGYTNSDSQNEGQSDDKDGSAWYIGARFEQR